jgi:hypothetical protein
MNLINETNKRLEYAQKSLNELNICLSVALSKDARVYIASEILKTKNRITYYAELVERLKIEEV